MKIITKLVARWSPDTGTWVTTYEESYEYDGPVALLCGATSAQSDIMQQQSAFSKQLTQQATQVFGDSSQVFNDLMSTFAPTVKAGPNQQGFSAAENANLQSQAITNTGNAYKNVKAAVGNAQAAEGGGNTNLPAGADTGVDLGVASSAADQTASELGRITEENYEVGRENYNNAVKGMAAAPSVFNPATEAANAATSSQEGAAKTANEIAQEQNSWVQGVTGALGGIAGGIMTGGMKNLGSGVGFFGQNAPAPGSNG